MSEQTVVKFKEPSDDEKRRERIPCLIVVEGNSIGDIHRITKESVLIGRGDQADLVLAEEGVSRQHARIDKHENAYTLVDLESTNGTFVNGDPVEQVSLRDGDKIRMGEVVLRFGYQDALDVTYQETLREMAMRDGLTKVFNRRYFMETMQRELSFAVRQRQPMTCIIFDVDHFKNVNDTYGHQAGDLVLRALARAMEKELRGYDVLARYGGEEFAILLRGTALDNALIFAERARKLVESLVIEFEGKRIAVTVSMGLASLDPDKAQTTVEGIVKEADHYLYEAKKNGRNKVASVRSRS